MFEALRRTKAERTWSVTLSFGDFLDGVDNVHALFGADKTFPIRVLTRKGDPGDANLENTTKNDVLTVEPTALRPATPSVDEVIRARGDETHGVGTVQMKN